MMRNALSSALVAFALSTAATLAVTITSPGNSTTWTIGGTSNSITWEASAGDPPTFNIQLLNVNAKIMYGALALANTVAATRGTFAVDGLDVNPGPGYTVIFTGQDENSTTLATSEMFTIVGTVATSSAAGRAASVSAPEIVSSTSIADVESASSARTTHSSSTSAMKNGTVSSITSSSTSATSTPGEITSAAGGNSLESLFLVGFASIVAMML